MCNELVDQGWGSLALVLVEAELVRQLLLERGIHRREGHLVHFARLRVLRTSLLLFYVKPAHLLDE